MDNTPEKDKVSLKEKTAYGLGAIGEAFVQNGTPQVVNPVFNVGLGVNAAWLGLATFVFRMIDAVTDPLVGMLTDNTRSRWGKRKPHLLIGGLLTAFFYILLWNVPVGRNEEFYFLWFFVVSFLMYIASSIYCIPYLAVGYELSSDYNERTRVVAFRTAFLAVAGICIQWMLWFAKRDIFKDTVEGMAYVGAGMGVMILISAMFPLLFTRNTNLDEMNALKAMSSENRKKRSQKLSLKDLLSVFSVYPFLLILLTLMTTVLGFFSVIIFGYYMNTFYVCGGNEKEASYYLGVQGTVYNICCILSLSLVVWVSAKLGKRRTLMLFMTSAIFFQLSKWVCYDPVYPYLQLVPVLGLAPGLSAFWTLLASMTADVCDWDEYKNGVRREGVFGSVYSWTQKLGFAVSSAAAGIILAMSTFMTDFGKEMGEIESQKATLEYRVYSASVDASSKDAVAFFFDKSSGSTVLFKSDRYAQLSLSMKEFAPLMEGSEKGDIIKEFHVKGIVNKRKKVDEKTALSDKSGVATFYSKNNEKILEMPIGKYEENKDFWLMNNAVAKGTAVLEFRGNPEKVSKEELKGRSNEVVVFCPVKDAVNPIFTEDKLVAYSKFNQDLVQNDEAMTIIRLCASCVPAVGTAFGILCIFLYPISPARARKIREALQARKEGKEIVLDFVK